MGYLAFGTPLDDLDYRLLTELQKDGRLSFTELAEDMGISVGTVRNRITRMIEEKTLQIVGRVDPSRVGLSTYAQLQMSIRPVRMVDAVAERLTQMDEVSFLATTTGTHDLEANIMCRDAQHMSEVVRNIQQIDGVFEIKTNLYFKVHKISQPDLRLLRKKSKEKSFAPSLGWGPK